MIEKMTAYFAAEKQESLLFMAAGVLAVAVAIWLYANGHRLKSMAFPRSFRRGPRRGGYLAALRALPG